METRKLGNSDLKVTPVGFGAWAVGGSGWEFAWGRQDDKDSIAAIHRALELGVNWIDTAAVYGLGHSEEVVARALEGWRGPRPYIFTKCVLTWDKTGKITPNHSAASIRRECEDSLSRHGSDDPRTRGRLATRRFSQPQPGISRAAPFEKPRAR